MLFRTFQKQEDKGDSNSLLMQLQERVEMRSNRLANMEKNRQQQYEEQGYYRTFSQGETNVFLVPISKYATVSTAAVSTGLFCVSCVLLLLLLLGSSVFPHDTSKPGIALDRDRRERYSMFGSFRAPCCRALKKTEHMHTTCSTTYSLRWLARKLT